MKCPICKRQELKKRVFYSIQVDTCKKCGGIWFDAEELRKAKDEKDKGLEWFDVEIWQDPKRFKAARISKRCPVCEVPLFEISYGDSEIKIDICHTCHGIWLDKGEFDKIIRFSKTAASWNLLNDYLSSLIEEAKELITGTEGLKSEIKDFLAVLKVLNYKFIANHPVISKIISELPK